MKSASFETREWIDPWRDRVPQTDGPVLVQAWLGGGWQLLVLRYRADTKEWDIGNVIAWMPLPDKYDPVAEAERQDEEERNPLVRVEKIR